MNILITGNVNTLCHSLTGRFKKEKFKSTVVAKDIKQTDKKVSISSINPADEALVTVFHNDKFDTVIYIAEREELLSFSDKTRFDNMVDAFSNTIEISAETGVRNFIFVSSLEVYGNSDKVYEKAPTNPTTVNALKIDACEKMCELYRKTSNMNVLILRVPFVYGEGEKKGIFYKATSKIKLGNEVFVPFKEDSKVSFINAEDVADFIVTYLSQKDGVDAPVVNLSTGKQIGVSNLFGAVADVHQNKSVKFADDNALISVVPPVESQAKLYGWTPKHHLDNDFNNFINYVEKEQAVVISKKEKISAFLKKHKFMQILLEVVLGAIVMELLNHISGTYLQFRYVDFRLLFVVIIGIVYGTKWGIVAFGFTSASFLFAWFKMGLEPGLLIYNVDNWLPIVIYFLAGVITGYIRDKSDNEIRFAKEQYALMSEKYDFLYQLYDDTKATRDTLRDQLMGYRDSFGRIYNVTRELDSKKQDAVMAEALGVLEDILQNNQVAIYSLDKYLNYSRLIVNSRALNGKLSKTLKLTDYEQVLADIKNGEIFVNRDVLPDYPSYVIPIVNQNTPVAVIVLWKVNFEQYSMYYINLIKVLCGLIQSSLVRAIEDANANAEKTYIKGTMIMKSENFKETLSIKRQMQEKSISNFQLLLVDYGNMSLSSVSEKLINSLRASDIIGLDNKDNCYILLSQVDEDGVDFVMSRLNSIGFASKKVGDICD